MRRPALLLPLLLAGCFPLFGGHDDGSHDTGTGDPGATGTLDDVWQRATTTFTVISGSGQYQTRTVAGPTPIPSPEDGPTLDWFVQISEGRLITTVWQEGDPVYHRLHQDLVVVDDTTFMVASTDGTRTFAMADGHLTEAAQTAAVNASVLTQATYGAYQGDFPPAGWPSTVLDDDLPGVSP